jgi:hypothetical protein
MNRSVYGLTWHEPMSILSRRGGISKRAHDFSKREVRRIEVISPSGRGAHFDYNRVDNCSSRERITTTIARSQLAFRAGSARLSLLQPRRQLRLSLR